MVLTARATRARRWQKWLALSQGEDDDDDDGTGGEGSKGDDNDDGGKGNMGLKGDDGDNDNGKLSILILEISKRAFVTSQDGQRKRLLGGVVHCECRDIPWHHYRSKLLGSELGKILAPGFLWLSLLGIQQHCSDYRAVDHSKYRWSWDNTDSK